MDRRSRFSPDPVLQSLRARAASQPPRSSGPATEYSLFAFPESNNASNQRSAQSPVRDPSWGQRIGRSPAAVVRVPQGQLRSASFSATAHPPENEGWPPGGGRFQSTFEEDDEESLDAWTDNFTGQPRSWANSDSRFRSQIPGTRSRSLVPNHGFSPSRLNGFSDEWNDRALSQSIDQRFLSGYSSSRVNGSRAHSLQGTSSMPAAIAQRASQAEFSNFSPFGREPMLSRISKDNITSSYDQWPSYMGTMREEEPGSGATSRRHSVSIVQPRARGVGFPVISTVSGDDAPQSRIVGGLNRSMFSDEELAGDFTLLNLNNNDAQGVMADLHSSGATSYPYTAGGSNNYLYSRPMNGIQSSQGYTTLDTHLHVNRTPSDGRSPVVGDSPFTNSNASGIDQLSAALSKVTHPSKASPLETLRSRDHSPVQQNGSHDHPDVVTPNDIYRSDFYSEQQLKQGGSMADMNQGIPVDDVPRSSRLVLLEFKLNRKEVFFCDSSLDVKEGDRLIVEGDRGKDIGIVVNPDVEKHWLIAQRQNAAADLGIPVGAHAKAKRVYGIAGPKEIQDLARKEEDEQKALQLCQNKVRQKKLPMQVVDCEFQWDRRKLTFYFIAESRIDFRDLVRELFRLYKTRIWMSCVSGPLAGPTANIIY